MDTKYCYLDLLSIFLLYKIIYMKNFRHHLLCLHLLQMQNQFDLLSYCYCAFQHIFLSIQVLKMLYLYLYFWKNHLSIIHLWFLLYIICYLLLIYNLDKKGSVFLVNLYKQLKNNFVLYHHFYKTILF